MDEKKFRPRKEAALSRRTLSPPSPARRRLRCPAWLPWRPPADIRGIIGSNAASKSVKVINNENETIVDVYLNLRLGARIPDVAGEVQHSVKVAVQSMTGKPVTKVNIHVAGIVLDEDKAD